MTIMELPDPDAAENAARGWGAQYVGKRRIASDRAYTLLLAAERAKRRDDLDGARELHLAAGEELGRTGMHGPLIGAELQRMAATAKREVQAEVDKFAIIAGRLANGLPHWTGKDCDDPVLHHRLERDAAQEKRQPVVHVDGLCSWCDGSTNGGWR